MLLTVGTGTFMSALNGSVVNAVLPLMRRGLHVDPATIERDLIRYRRRVPRCRFGGRTGRRRVCHPRPGHGARGPPVIRISARALARIPRRAIAEDRELARGPRRLAAGGLDELVIGRERASGIGRGGVSRQEEGLAAAPAEIDRSLLAAPARLRHPGLAAKGHQAGRGRPQLFDGTLANVPEGKSGQRVREQTGEKQPIGRDDHEAAAPAVHARGRELGVVVGNDEYHFHPPFQPRPSCGGDGPRLLELCLGGEERGPVPVGPAEVLGVGQLQAVGVQLLGKRDDLADALEVLPVQDRVHGQWEPQLLHPAGHLELAMERLASGDAIRLVRPRVLDRYLDVVEAEPPEALETHALERYPAGDQVAVEVERTRLSDERLEIGSQQRLAAGEVDLHHAQFLGLAQDTLPVGLVERVVVASEIDRVRAVDAMEGAGVRELGDERVGSVCGAHPGTCTRPRLAISSRNSRTSRRSSSADRSRYSPCSFSTMPSTVSSPSQSLRMLAAVAFRASPLSGYRSMYPPDVRSNRRRAFGARAGLESGGIMALAGSHPALPPSRAEGSPGGARGSRSCGSAPRRNALEAGRWSRCGRRTPAPSQSLAAPA